DTAAVPRSTLSGPGDGLIEVSRLVDELAGHVAATRRDDTPLPPMSPDKARDAVDALLGPPRLSEDGLGVSAGLRVVAEATARYGLDLSHPHAAAHLQPPPLSVAVAADVLASAGNASVDTYDSGPSAIAVERWLVKALAGVARLGPSADGVLTPGGSLSNLMGLLLARDAAATRIGVDVRAHGVAALPNPVVYCSELAHFSVHRACATLGLGEAAVAPIPCDARNRMRADVLASRLRSPRPDQTPLAIVATAGTTDFGSVDPLPQSAEIAAEHGVWLHVDAAYGFGTLLSRRLDRRLEGLELADSVTVDLHKLGWQPAAASALLVSDVSAFHALGRTVDYLNPDDDAATGYDGLLGRSLQTTRRADAVKVAATLLALGRRGLGDMVDACHDLARHAEARVLAEPDLEWMAPADLTTVVFRFRAGDSQGDDAVNARLRRDLIESGNALIGRTTVNGPDGPRVCLKFTFLNPGADARDVDALVDAVVERGRELRNSTLVS
ncbi:MAG: pyridoxal phosphate-dependent decarboxylase family protein, partial [Stackebrandtia sp.]